MQHRVDAERAHGDACSTATPPPRWPQKLRGNPADILYALSLFEASNVHAVHPGVPSLLAPRIRRGAGARRGPAVAAPTCVSVQREVEKLLRDPHLEVRTEALLYVTRHSHTDPLTLIEEWATSRTSRSSASMIAFLARPGRAQNLEAAQLMLQRMVAESGDDGLRSRVEAARVIGLVARRLRPRTAQAARGRRARGGPRSGPVRRACSASGSSCTGSSTASPSRGSPTTSSPRWPASATVSSARCAITSSIATRRRRSGASCRPCSRRSARPPRRHVLIESMLDGDTVLRTAGADRAQQAGAAPPRPALRSADRRDGARPPRSPATTGRIRCWRRSAAR